ncbi:Hypothetical predicted protein, partial [Xyrichtys novacula]
MDRTRFIGGQPSVTTRRPAGSQGINQQEGCVSNLQLRRHTAGLCEHTGVQRVNSVAMQHRICRRPLDYCVRKYMDRFYRTIAKVSSS